MSTATAIAHPNIALAKYWGKRAGEGNRPAVPSLSVTLEGMSTRTQVTFDAALGADEVRVNDALLEGEGAVRAIALLDRVRARRGEARRARVVSTNDFPTASGLASSASGFAALAFAASAAAGLDLGASALSDLARRSSASAARSILGGFVELAAGGEDPNAELAAHVVAPPEHMDLAVLVAVTHEGPKAVGSTDGMTLTRTKSPYFAVWIDAAPRIFAELRGALLARDFAKTGELAEASALAMHASAIAAGVVYWTAATLDVIHAVRALRAAGEAAYFTIDAGPHVKVLVPGARAEQVRAKLAEVRGVLAVRVTRPGGGARLA